MMEREWTLNESELLALQFQLSTDALPSKDQRLREVHLHEIKLIEDYLKIHRPLLSQARREIIEQKLDLEKAAEKKTRARAKQDQYFVKYDYNPLSEKENIRANRSHSRRLLKSIHSARKLGPLAKEKEEKEEVEVGLIDAVHNIKNHNFRKGNQRLLKLSASALHLSSQIGYEAKNLAYDLTKKGKGASTENLQEQILSFDQILALPDKNYYVQNQGPINIFEFMHGNHRSILNRDILTKFHFNFTSCLDKLQRFKIQIYRELSLIGRTLVFKTNIPKSVRLDVLNSNEMSVNLKDIRFADLISISSGRLDPSLVYSILYEGNAQKDASPNSSLVDEEDDIHYRPNQQQKCTNYSFQLSAKQERDQYLQLENSAIEEMSVRRYQNIYRHIESNVEKVRNLKSNTINDINLHQAFNKFIKKDIEAFAKIDKQPTVKPDRLIRENKIGKNRQERLKIRELIKAIQLTNQYQEKLAPILSKSKSKSKSKNKC